jgi:NagD protein
MKKDDRRIQLLSGIQHLALDMDGTIHKDGTLFDFTRPFLTNMRELGIGYTFLTNNSSRSARDYLLQLREMNLELGADQIFTSGLATIEYLRDNHPDSHNLFILGTESLCKEFSEAGFSVVDSTTDEPDAVVVGFDPELTYQRLCAAGYWIDLGKTFIATHPDAVCPTDRKTLLVDCGAICACLAKATGRSPDIVLGKPHPCMLDGILRRHRLEPDQLAMVGDRLYTDVAMARVAGVLGVLVLTGEATASDVNSCSTPPDVVVADLRELEQLLRDAIEKRVPGV